jgi:hypothetical protein
MRSNVTTTPSDVIVVVNAGVGGWHDVEDGGGKSEPECKFVGGEQSVPGGDGADSDQDAVNVCACCLVHWLCLFEIVVNHVPVGTDVAVNADNSV